MGFHLSSTANSASLTNSLPSLMSLFYHQPGIHMPASAPRIPMPQKIPTAPPLSSYMGEIFPYLCRFWEIVHGVGALYHEDGNLPWGSSSSLAFAEMKFRELLAWSNGLPYQLTSQHENPHSVQVMQLVSKTRCNLVTFYADFTDV